jgi:DUF4097 and DUF4098 domain-containing protein YvlB
MSHKAAPGALDRTFTVDGPVRLELTNGSGDSKVIAGSPGEVRVHADFRVKSWSTASAQKRMAELGTNPPISQEGNLIRIGGPALSMGGTTVDYTIMVPADSQIRGITSSGGIEITGIHGPANFTSGSGNISATAISGDVQARSGSGTIQLASVEGQVEATTGSGDVNLADVRGGIRIQTGSGTIRMAQPAGAVVATSASGSINAAGVKDDLRLRTNSGSIAVVGDPHVTTYWDLRTSSGNVALQVPATASFRFYARTRSGDINAAIPIVMEGTAGKHELRARIGDGRARVEVETTSGNIALH